MSTLLHIETSTNVCSVAVSHQGVVVFEQIESEGPSHATHLPRFVEAALNYVKQQELNLEAVAVSSGPGSYTGLRIGVSTAKGVCYALGLPLIAIDTLAVLAQGAMKSGLVRSGIVVPMIDARRMEVYTRSYSEQLVSLNDVEAKIIDVDSFAEELGQDVLNFCGNGSYKCKPVLTHEHAHYINDIVPLARNMVGMAQQAYDSGSFEDVAYYEPFYLKEFQGTLPKQKL